MKCINNYLDGGISKFFTSGTQKLIKNFNSVIENLEKEKANTNVKGDLIKSAYITSTMGVSYKLKVGKTI